MDLYIVKASEYLNVKHGWLRVWRKYTDGKLTSERVESWQVYRTRNAAKTV
jgi:hypothetical protein